MHTAANRWDGRDWLFALLFLLGTVLAALFFQRQFLLLPGPDAVLYMGGAESLVSTGEYRSPVSGLPIDHPPPLASLLIALAFKLFGTSFAAAKAVMAALAGIAVAGTYLLGRMHHGRGTAALAAGLVASTPMFFESALNVNSDVLGVAFMTWALIALMRATVRQSMAWAALAGLFLGLGGLGRTVFPPFIIVAAAYTLLRTRKWRLALPVLIIGLLVLSPWIARTVRLAGSPLYNPSVNANLPVIAGVDPLNAGYEQLSFQQTQGPAAPGGIGVLGFLRKIVTHIVFIGGYYLPSMAGVLLLLFALLGLVLEPALLRSRDWFLVAFAYTVALLTLAYPLARYFLVILPPLAVLAAGGFLQALRHATASLRAPGKTIVACVAILLFIHGGLSQLAPRLAGPDAWSAQEAREYLAAGDWLRSNTPQGAAIIARDTRIAYYAQRKFELMPPYSLQDTIAFARAKNASYIVYDERAAYDRRPALRMLAEAEPIDGLRLAHVESNGKLDLFIWEIEPAR
jgi:4-amino-4-deoxy-L-arabinose transferase-like glycosyltransferase